MTFKGQEQEANETLVGSTWLNDLQAILLLWPNYNKYSSTFEAATASFEKGG